ncbi:MAG: hypothetical protein J5U16_05990 [Candidatus Methanoperedens sp.]|nr:hypothetical protein [Candidatus Methanoperedens sp.]
MMATIHSFNNSKKVVMNEKTGENFMSEAKSLRDLIRIRAHNRELLESW